MSNVHQFKSREDLIKETEVEYNKQVLETVNKAFWDDDQICISVIYPGAEEDSSITIIPNVDLADNENILRVIAILDQAKQRFQYLIGGFPYFPDLED